MSIQPDGDHPEINPNDKQKCGTCHGLTWVTVENSFYPRTKPCPSCAPRGGATAPLDGSTAEVKRLLDNLDEIKRNTVVSSHRDAVDEVCEFISARASAYDAVVAENARLKERLRDFAGKGTEYASRVAELERALQPLASFPIEQHQHRSTSGAPLCGFNGWLLLPGHVYAARAAISKGSQPCP